MCNHQQSSYSDTASNNDKQSNDGDAMDDENDARKNTSDVIENNGESKAADTSDTNTADKPEERPLPRIQIKTPSKLEQEYSDKQKQLDEQNLTNSASETITTPLVETQIAEA